MGGGGRRGVAEMAGGWQEAGDDRSAREMTRATDGGRE